MRTLGTLPNLPSATPLPSNFVFRAHTCLALSKTYSRNPCLQVSVLSFNLSP